MRKLNLQLILIVEKRVVLAGNVQVAWVAIALGLGGSCPVADSRIPLFLRLWMRQKLSFF